MPDESQVLYRRWRPQRFDEVAGQDHVSQTLRQAVSSGRVSHAYLLCGPRGTGKTSTARILAKALNCQNPQDGEPDGTCDNCVAVVEGRMMDLIELDAASNRGINDIRDLREKVRFAPGAGRYKVYVIDEVHQLTEAAFNALLKTLEEPPPHTVMVLATTEAHKVPATIVSRCQRFDFRRLPNEAVIDKLAEICGAEEIDAEPEVLPIIARAAYGSLRDAENMLEQLTISYGSEVTADEALEMLGMGDSASSVELAAATLRGDVKAALDVINREAARGTELTRLRTGAVDALRAALLLKAGVEDALGHPEAVVSGMSEAGRGVSLEKLLHTLSEFGKVDFRQDAFSPLPLELAVLGAVAGPQQAAAAPAPAAAVAPAPPGRSPAGPPRARPSPPRTTPPPPSRAARPQPPAPPAAAGAAGASQPRRPRTPSDERWGTLVMSLNRTRGVKYNLGALLRDVETVEVTEGQLSIRFRNASNRERMAEELDDPRSRSTLESAVEGVYGARLGVRLADGQGAPGPGGGAGSAMDSALVRAAVTMGARIIDGEADTGAPPDAG